MIKLKDLFHIEYGNQMDLNKLEQVSSEEGIRFISRSSEDLGFQCYVKTVDDLKLYKKGSITVTLGGTYLLSAFVQPGDFYTSQNIKVLIPKKEMSEAEKYFYCYAISQNRFRYTSHGREANKTLDDLPVPALDEIPSWVHNSFEVPVPDKKPCHSKEASLDDREWKWFEYKDVFHIKKGFYNKKPHSENNGGIPFIGATSSNNGITSYHTIEEIESATKTGKGKNHPLEKKIFKGGEHITISNNGSVGYAFFQPVDFTCSHDVNPISLKGKKMTPFIAIFLCSLIHLEKFRWDYGRKWRPIRMPKSKIKLPVDTDGNPDWNFMEYYIKSLPYSTYLDNKSESTDFKK